MSESVLRLFSELGILIFLILFAFVVLNVPIIHDKIDSIRYKKYYELRNQCEQDRKKTVRVLDGIFYEMQKELDLKQDFLLYLHKKDQQMLYEEIEILKNRMYIIVEKRREAERAWEERWKTIPRTKKEWKKLQKKQRRKK